jgi:KDO2-lipid IV(A) lauroyltransferase
MISLMSHNQPKEKFYTPRYWPTWIMIFLFKLWAKLPWSGQYKIAQILSIFLGRLAKRRRNIVATNLQLCFPEWDAATQKQKTDEVMFNNTLGIVESISVYHRPVESYRAKLHVEGLDVLNAATAKGKGVLLLGAHYSHLDLGGALVSLVCDPYAIYRPNNNPLLDQYIINGRMSFMKGVIKRTDMRGIVKALKRNEIVWYPPDQDYGKQHAVFAPFFGVNAATITATTRLVKFNQSAVVMMSCYRNDDTGDYHLSFHQAPAEFPSGDDTLDATLINSALETCIRKSPTQYMWTHRRFKTQPDGRAKLYL